MQPTALARYRAECARAIDCKSLKIQGTWLQCPGCEKMARELYQVEQDGKPVGLRCWRCSQKVLGRIVL